MKEKAHRGKAPAAAKSVAPTPKTVELWCDECHTKWVEGCLQAWNKCPFVDCKGTLRNFPQAQAPRRPKYEKPKGFPLLEASDDVA
jgi:hypothetical protein